MIVFLFQLFAALSGCIEAILYALRGAESFRFNEHLLFAGQRLSVLLLVLAAAWLPGHLGFTPASVSMELLPGLLLFPMAHDEAYNFTRLWLTYSEKYQAMPTLPGTLSPDRAALKAAWYYYRYGYQSPTTTARNDFNGKQRTALAVAALVLWAGGAYLLLSK